MLLKPGSLSVLRLSCLLLFVLAVLQRATFVSGQRSAQSPVHPGGSSSADDNGTDLELEYVDDPIPASTRAFWMRRAVASLSELSSPCPFAAFGTVVVNHTASEHGELVCIGANAVFQDGNPTLHGEFLCLFWGLLLWEVSPFWGQHSTNPYRR